MKGPVDIVIEREAVAVRVRNEREGLWRVLQNYVRPTSLTYEERQGSADVRERRILESTAATSLELFASFLMSSVLVAGTAGAPAFRIVPASASGRPLRREEVSPEFLMWQERAVEEIRHAMFSGPRSGVEVLHNVCLDLGVYGTACFAIWEDPDGVPPLRWSHYPVWAVSGELGPDGDISAVYINERMTRRRAMMRWPEMASVFERASEEVELLYVAMSADDPDVEVVFDEATRARGGSWYGMWVLRNPRTVVSTAAYMEQPIFMPAWYRVDNTVWGRSPAMTAIGDIVTANSLMELIIRGTEKLVDPPWVVADGALLSPLRLHPGGITYTDGNAEGLSPLLPPGASRIDIGTALLQDRVARIERAFFLHLFQDTNPTGSKQPRTAYEVALTQDERNRAVAPMVQRLQSKMIDPMVWRVLGVLVRNGVVPPPPLDIGRRMVLVHRSPVVASQQQLDAMNVMRWLESAAIVAQMDPSALDWIDGDAVVKRLHESSGAPIGVLRSRSDVEALRAARAQQTQAQKMVEAAPAIAQAGQAVAKIMAAGRSTTPG